MRPLAQYVHRRPRPSASPRSRSPSTRPGRHRADAHCPAGAKHFEVGISGEPTGSLRPLLRTLPSAGRIAQADRLQLGQQVVQGLPVLTLVGDGTSYIEANFKETDLADMQVGQPAEVHFDAYPGLKLRGHVESIGAGTGNEFSVIPAQNATGNWVKVTQRVPVRIAIDEKSARPLIAGLSTEVTVFTDGKKH